METFLNWIKDNQVLSGSGALIISGMAFLGKKFFSVNKKAPPASVEDLKKNFRVLFVDDNQFKVTDILKKSGWLNVKRVKDITSFDDAEIKATNLFFVDIQGVGKALKFSDEGLGLAQALKEKFPGKKVVIYSAENQGDRFHKALRIADATLPKNAEPYEFLTLVEQFALGDGK